MGIHCDLGRFCGIPIGTKKLVFRVYRWGGHFRDQKLAVFGGYIHRNWRGQAPQVDRPPLLPVLVSSRFLESMSGRTSERNELQDRMKWIEMVKDGCNLCISLFQILAVHCSCLFTPAHIVSRLRTKSASSDWSENPHGKLPRFSCRILSPDLPSGGSFPSL